MLMHNICIDLITGMKQKTHTRTHRAQVETFNHAERGKLVGENLETAEKIAAK